MIHQAIFGREGLQADEYDVTIGKVAVEEEQIGGRYAYKWWNFEQKGVWTQNVKFRTKFAGGPRLVIDESYQKLI